MEFQQRTWRRTSLSVAKTISVPTALFQRFAVLKVKYPMLNLSRIATAGITRVLDDLERDCGEAIKRYGGELGI